MTEKFLIVLTNRSDEDIMLVPGPVKDWISTPPAFNGATWIREAIPSECLPEGYDYEPMFASITNGSFENDRALSLAGTRFSTESAARAYAAENGITINGKFEGYIY